MSYHIDIIQAKFILGLITGATVYPGLKKVKHGGAVSGACVRGRTGFPENVGLNPRSLDLN